MMLCMFHQFAFGHRADVHSEQQLLKYIMEMTLPNVMLISAEPATEIPALQGENKEKQKCCQMQ